MANKTHKRQNQKEVDPLVQERISKLTRLVMSGCRLDFYPGANSSVVLSNGQTKHKLRISEVSTYFTNSFCLTFDWRQKCFTATDNFNGKNVSNTDLVSTLQNFQEQCKCEL